MARTTGANAKTPPQELPKVPSSDEPIDAGAMLQAPAEPELEPQEAENSQAPELESPPETLGKAQRDDDIQTVENIQTVDDILNSLKALLSSVEKLQKVRQEVGDIKPLLIRMLDGEVVSGEDLEQLKTGVGGLLRLVRAHGDHQAALAKAQMARTLLDEVLKVTP